MAQDYHERTDDSDHADHFDGSKMDRNSDGTFAVGWRGGPGRPKRTEEHEYLSATFAGVSVKDWSGIIDVAKRQALEGDEKARAFLAKYLMPQGPLVAVQQNFGTAPVTHAPGSHYRMPPAELLPSLEDAIRRMAPPIGDETNPPIGGIKEPSDYVNVPVDPEVVEPSEVTIHIVPDDEGQICPSTDDETPEVATIGGTTSANRPIGPFSTPVGVAPVRRTNNSSPMRNNSLQNLLRRRR